MSSCVSSTLPGTVSSSLVTTVSTSFVLTTGAPTVTQTVVPCPPAPSCPVSATCSLTCTGPSTETVTLPGSVASSAVLVTGTSTTFFTAPGIVQSSCVTLSSASSSDSPPTPSPAPSSAPQPTQPSTPGPTTTAAPNPATTAETVVVAGPNRTSTFYSTRIITSTNAAGASVTSTSITPLLASSAPTSFNQDNDKSAPIGAIVGGAVGGIVALLVLFVILSGLRRKGYLGRGGRRNDVLDFSPVAHHSPSIPGEKEILSSSMSKEGSRSPRRWSGAESYYGPPPSGDAGAQRGGRNSMNGFPTSGATHGIGQGVSQRASQGYNDGGISSRNSTQFYAGRGTVTAPAPERYPRSDAEHSEGGRTEATTGSSDQHFSPMSLGGTTDVEHLHERPSLAQQHSSGSGPPPSGSTTFSTPSNSVDDHRKNDRLARSQSVRSVVEVPQSFGPLRVTNITEEENE